MKVQPEFLRSIVEDEIQKNNKQMIKTITQEIQENMGYLIFVEGELFFLKEATKSISEKKNEKTEQTLKKLDKRNSQITSNSVAKPFPLKKSVSQHIKINSTKGNNKPNDPMMSSKSLVIYLFFVRDKIFYL